jgi:hypothetical protein
VRYTVAGLAVLAVVAVAVAHDGRDASGTDVPTIELRSDEVSEPQSSRRARPMKKRKEESAGTRTRSGRGAAPAPAQAPAPAGDDDGDDDGD